MIRESSVTSVISAVFQNSRSAFWIGPNCHTSFQANPALWVFLLPISSSLPLCHFAAGRRGWAHWGTNIGRVVQSSSYKLQGEATWARSTQHLVLARRLPKCKFARPLQPQEVLRRFPHALENKYYARIVTFQCLLPANVTYWTREPRFCHPAFADLPPHTNILYVPDTTIQFNHSIQ